MTFDTIRQKCTKRLAIAASVVLVFGAVIAGTVTQGTPASAASCDRVNIVYCGLTGNSVDDYINSFRANYNAGNNNGYNDLKAIYNWAGANQDMVNGMSRANTKLGTMYRNGNVQVGGTVVGTGAWVTARFTQGAGYVQVTSHSWARQTTTSLAEATAPVIIHFNSNGNADFVVMVDCGNAVRITVVPQPSLQCVNLVGTEVGTTRQYSFKAAANAANTRITKYTFDFGGGKTAAVTTGASTASTTYLFGDFSTSYTVRVTVFANDFGGGVTGPDCVTTIKTPAQPPTPQLACISLTPIQGDTRTQYNFTIVATASKTTITKYVINFGDGTSATLSSPTASHSYPAVGGNYTATASVFSTDFPNGVTGPNCTANLSNSVPVPNPTAVCVGLTSSLISDATHTYSFTATAQQQTGVTFKSADFNFGDGQTSNGITPTGPTVTSQHTYTGTQNYTVVATLYFSVNGNSTSANCMTAISIPNPGFTCTPGGPAPTDTLCTPCKYNPAIPTSDTKDCVAPAGQLVNTGAGSVIAIFVTVAIGGFFVTRQVMYRRAMVGAHAGATVASQADLIAASHLGGHHTVHHEGSTHEHDHAAHEHEPVHHQISSHHHAPLHGQSVATPNMHRSRRFKRKP